VAHKEPVPVVSTGTVTARRLTEPEPSGMLLILVVNTAILVLVASVAFAALEIVTHIWA